MNQLLWTMLIAAGAALIYGFPIRAWFFRWGAAPDDLERVMPGDACVDRPTYATTLAIRIQARPEHVWPWLVQMGHKRGGLYSYDWLDRMFGYLDRPSATRILPEWQNLKVGDRIPLGRGAAFPVCFLAPNQSLVMADNNGGFGWSWEFGLYQTGRTETTLVSRNRARVPTSWRWAFGMRLLEPAAFLMTRRMLLGLQRRAEALAADTGVRVTRAA